MKPRVNFLKNSRIAFICFSESYGGLEMSLIQLARELNERNADCLLVVRRQSPLAEQAMRHGLPIDDLSPMIEYGALLASLKLARILRNHGVQIAVAMRSRDMNVLAAAKLAYRRLTLVFYQQMQSGMDKRDPLHTWIYSRFSLWISLTERMKQEVVQYTRMPEELVTVIPLGRDTHLFDPKKYDRSTARKRFNLPPEGTVVGMLGRLDPQKGQVEFLRALASIRRRQPRVCFAIAGDETRGEGGYQRYLVDLSDELGVSEHVRFLPFTERVPEFLAAIDIFVLPSYAETFGLVLIEAMAMEIPVIATWAGGVPDIIENGGTGILIPPKDQEALANAIVTLLEDPHLRKTLAQRARLDVLQRFESTSCIDKLVLALDAL